MVEYELVYFKGKGLGEVIRLIFAAAGKKYTDTRVTEATANDYKSKSPFKVLPVLIIKDNGQEKVYCQSGAISRFLGREFEFGGSNNVEQFEIDEAFGCLDDVFSAAGRWFYEKDTERKDQLSKQLKDRFLPSIISYLNGRLKSQTSGFLVGSKMTVADVYAFNVIDQLKNNGQAAFDSEKEIMKFYKKIGEQEGIAKWLKERPQD